MLAYDKLKVNSMTTVQSALSEKSFEHRIPSAGSLVVLCRALVVAPIVIAGACAAALAMLTGSENALTSTEDAVEGTDV